MPDGLRSKTLSFTWREEDYLGDAVCKSRPVVWWTCDVHDEQWWCMPDDLDALLFHVELFHPGASVPAAPEETS